MGKKHKGPNGRKKMGLGIFLHECEDESSGSGKEANGDMGTLDALSSSVLEESTTGLMNKKSEVSLQPLKSPSCFRALGEFDTDSDTPSEENQPIKAVDGEENVKEPSEKKAPWVNLFKDNRKSDQSPSLKMFHNLPDQVHLTYDIVDNVETAWGYCLVGYFAGRFPGKKALLNLCDSWNVSYKYYTRSSGWLVFKFENNSDRESVLNGGPYFVFGRALLLKIMPEFFEFDDEDISRMPVWVTLPGLPLDCWNAEALGMIASKFGRPISMDNLTATRGRLSYARVLIKVDAARDLVRNVNILSASGKVRDQTVIYEHEPKFCACCRVFGHSLSNCAALDKSLETNSKEPVLTIVSDGIPSSVPIAAPHVDPIQPQINNKTSQNQPDKGTSPPIVNPPPAMASVQLAGITENQGQPEVLEGHDPFILVENNKKRMGKQKGKTQDKAQQPLRSQAGTSSFAALDRVLEKKFLVRNGLQKQGHTSSSSDKLKGSSLSLSP